MAETYNKSLKTDLKRLIGESNKTGTSALPAVPPVKPIEKSVGFGKPAERIYQQPSGAAGIASPVTETTYEVREYHPTESITTSDGVFTMNIKRIKKIYMKDAYGSDAAFVFKAPVTP